MEVEIINTLLWVLQGILGVKLAAAAVSHGLQHQLETMQDAIQGFGPALLLLYSAAVGMLLTGVLLVAPAVINMPGELTPITAGLAALLMLISVGLHAITREDPKIFASLILFAMALFVAYGRWQLAPL